ncbi:MAG: acyltransferase [Haliscomenobacteraceae bacterium CHB4]|nr:acyltransferase [Haliscomenobacteraceae bacterium CHB4]
MGESKHQGKNRLLELDALRGIAALMVVLFHFTMERPEMYLGFKYGVTGVDFFFIISGFVIFLTLSSTKNWKDFVVSRFSRLFPTYWAVVTFTALMTVVYRLLHHESMSGLLTQYLGNMTMIQYYFKIPNLDEPYWTLLIEMQFYVVMLLIFSLRWLNRITLIGLAGLAFVTLNHFVLSGAAPLIFKFSRGLVGLINHFPLFFAGILFYKIKFHQGRRLSKIPLLAACLGAQIVLYPDGGTSFIYISQVEYAAMLAIYFTVFSLYAFDIPLRIVNRATVFLGTISYSLYLVHKFVCKSLIIPALEQVGLHFWVIVFAVCLPVVILLATLITFYVEKPALQYIRDRYKKASRKKNLVDTAPVAN